MTVLPDSDLTAALPTSAPASSFADWRALPIAQQPAWPDLAVLGAVAAELSSLPPLVMPSECDSLRTRLASVARGEAFLLQGGDCAETFVAATYDQIRDKIKTLLQMAAVLTYGASVPVVKVGRIAGQYAKPRSSGIEKVDGMELPSYRGDAVNDLARTLDARTPDPRRLLRAYHSAASTLNLMRAFATGGDADLRAVHHWNKDFVKRSPAGQRYEQIAGEIDRAIAFMSAIGIDLDQLGAAHGVELYSSHEALLLEYEAALTRSDENGRDYDLSAHMVWVGERTRALDGAHIAFAQQINNPIGIKLGPTAKPSDAAALIEALDPDATPGRLTVITRLGARKVTTLLPALVEAVEGDRSPGRVDVRPDARQHDRVVHRLQDAPLRRRARRGARLLRGARAARHHPGRHPHRADRRGRHRVSRRRAGHQRCRPRWALRDGLRPAAQHRPVARAGVPGGRDAPAPPHPQQRVRLIRQQGGGRHDRRHPVDPG